MIVLITGASSGIGEATARAFAWHGANLVLVARRMRRLRALAADLPTATHLVELDIQDRDAVCAALAALPEPFRAIDVLVNNAGLSRGLDPIHEGRENDWEEMIDTNLKGLLYLTRAVLPGMVARGRGHVINIGSVAGHEPYAGGNVYCATKAAVRMLNKAMRLDLLGTGIRVTGIDPGMVATEFSQVRFHGDRDRAAKVYENTRPLSPADVAEAILWCVGLPTRVNPEQILLTPTDQASPTAVHRRHSSSEESELRVPLAPAWLAAWNARDLSQLSALYSPTGLHSGAVGGESWEQPAPLQGRAAIEAYARRTWEQFPALRLEPRSVASGLRAAFAEYRVRGGAREGSATAVLERSDDGRIVHARIYRP